MSDSAATASALAKALEQISSTVGPIAEANIVGSEVDYVTTMEMLKALGLIKPNAESGYCVASEVAAVFMRSLAQYIRAGKPAIEGWSRWTSPNDQTGSAIRNGPRLTLEMEEARAAWENAVPIRTTSVAQVVIKAYYGWKLGERFLVRWDSKARSFQLVGGHERADDASFGDVIMRELEEEIPAYVSPSRDRLVSGPSSHTMQVSRTYGALTEYRMQFYTITFAKSPPAPAQSERWVTLREMVQQCTRQGEKINLLGLVRAVDNLHNYLEDLPSSYQARIMPPGREIASQILKWVLVVLGVVGGLVALVQAALWIFG